MLPIAEGQGGTNRDSHAAPFASRRGLEVKSTLVLHRVSALGRMQPVRQAATDPLRSFECVC